VSLVDAALAGPPIAPEVAAGRSAFIAGNVGKLGGELLNVLLESPRYSRVAVAVRTPMRVVVPKLETVVMPAAPGWVPDDVYLCIETETPSYWKSAKPYVAVASESAVEIARKLRISGARRIAVLTPLEALLQLGMASALRNADELAIVNAGYERVLILRPVADGQASKSSGVMQAIGGGVVRILASYMTPRSLQPVRRRQAAQAAVESLSSLANGVHIIGAGQLRELVGDPLGWKRLY
jgi:hypothetical protein